MVDHATVSVKVRFRVRVIFDIGLGLESQGLHPQILMMEGGGGVGSDSGSYFIPKKVTASEFVYPKKSLLF